MARPSPLTYFEAAMGFVWMLGSLALGAPWSTSCSPKAFVTLVTLWSWVFWLWCSC